MVRFRLSTVLLVMALIAVLASWQLEQIRFKRTLKNATEAQQLLHQIGDLVGRKRESGNTQCDVSENLDRWLVLHAIDLYENAGTMNDLVSMLDKQKPVVGVTRDILDCLGLRNTDDYFESLTLIGAPRGKYAVYADAATADHLALRRFIEKAARPSIPELTKSQSEKLRRFIESTKRLNSPGLRKVTVERIDSIRDVYVKLPVNAE